MNGPGPSFPITGHPQRLTGYYKYSPQYGDSLRILILLSSNGTVISGSSFVSGDTTLDWAPFNITFPAYVSADSGSILLAAYNAKGNPPAYAPKGNSVLYVDNLNFDNLITSTSSVKIKKNLFSLYPNPASDFVFLKTDLANNSEATLNIYNIIGELARTEKLKSNQEKINIGDLNCGVYMLEIKSKESSEKQKLIIQ